ncbi:hypothetical protein ACHQM5_008180 [Ranunculus cassubicifolius]
MRKRGIHEHMTGYAEMITDTTTRMRNLRLKRSSYLLPWEITETTMKMRNLRLKRSSYLPWEVIFNILLRLSVKILVEFKTVCKTWYSIIKDPRFIELHMSQSSFQGCLPYALLHRGCENMQTIYLIVDEGDGECRWKAIKEDLFDKIGVARNFHVSGCCNGLFCIFPHLENQVDPIFICNVATRECSKVPATEELIIFRSLLTGRQVVLSKLDPSFRVLQQEIGFGYENHSKRYKLVRMFWLYYNEEYFTVGEIMTVGERFWRRLEFPHLLYLRRMSQTLCVQGSCYWIINYMVGFSSPNDILVLDFCTEKFSTIEFPLLMAVETTVETRRVLLNLGGSLGVGDLEVHQCKTRIWKLIQGNWVFQYTVINMQVGTMHIDDNIFLTAYHDGIKAHLVLHDARLGHATKLEVFGSPPTFDTICFVPSLVSPRLLINSTAAVQSRRGYHDATALSILLS